MSEVEALEAQREELKKSVEYRDAVARLSKNRDFRKVIHEYYMVEECARYAQLSADPMLAANERADALSMAQAAGHLKRFLHVVSMMGNTAEDTIGRINEALEEIRAGEGAED